MTFNDILSYYQNNLQDKSLAIGIVGNKNKIDMEQLKKYGRVIVLKKNNIWN